MSDPAVPTVSRQAPVGMITLRADLGEPAVAEAVGDVTGCAVPAALRIETAGDRAAAWMSPDELMLFVPRAEAAEAVARLNARLDGTHRLVADVSEARALFRVAGRGAREIVAKGAPIDLAPTAFGPGDFRRTRLGQVAAAIWMRDSDALELMCFSSVAGFVEAWLATAAEPGTLPGFFEP